jgi:nucleotide-binding universal stress UspA family protein
MKIALRQILVPTDFSDESRAALAYGAALAGTFNASLHVLHVLKEIVAPESVPVQFETRQLRAAVEATAWDELRALLSIDDDDARLQPTLAIEWGLPAMEIIRYAQEHEVDLIAMGTHGRGGLKRLLLGSVAESVVRGAPCPVLTIHHWDRQVSARPADAPRKKHGT